MRRNGLVAYRPPRVAMGLALVAIAANALLPVQLHVGLPAAGSAIGLVGLAVMLRAWWIFKIVETAICPTEPSAVLVTHDVFSVTRNPMYLGMIMMLVAPALAIGTLPFYAAAGVFALFIDRVFCPYEESKALLEFGAKYETYRRNVRRWL